MIVRTASNCRLCGTAWRARAGLTLTEILISIMIMGVGVLALLTLFPLGILRMAQATRATRSAMLSESAGSDMAGRGLLYKPSFYTSWYGPPTRAVQYDPFLYDPVNPNNAAAPGGVSRFVGNGLPVAYDPLWWYELMVQTAGGVNPTATEARFGSGIGFLRNDPDGGAPSAYGLQRLTNFVAPPPLGVGGNLEPIFASTDDYVYQAEGNADVLAGRGNTTVPQMSDTNGDGVIDSRDAPLADLMFTWMFTGRQTDVGNSLVFDGDIVVFHNRPFALDTVNSPFGGPTLRAAGEVVVEALWGAGPPPAVGPPYSLNSTSVLLRWPVSAPDPEVRIGSWIADVTYERVATTSGTRYGSAVSYPGQRCHWYRVIRRTEPALDPAVANFKRMTVTVDRPLRAQTPVAPDGSPLRTEAALIGSYVVNVFPKVFIVQ